MNSVPRLSGDGVVLRPHRADDVPRIVEACSDAETSYWLGTLPAPYDEIDARAWLDLQADQVAVGETAYWVIADPVTDQFVGSISLMDLFNGSGPEVGYLAHPEARGRGVMTAAVGLVVRHAFAARTEGGLGFGKLRLESALGNTASRRVAEKAGFREAGLARRTIICRDGMHDAMRYVLLVTDLR